MREEKESAGWGQYLQLGFLGVDGGPRMGVHSHPNAGHGWGTPEGTHRLCCFAGTSKSGRLHMWKHTAIKANSSGGGQRTQVVPAFPLITGRGQTI